MVLALAAGENLKRLAAQIKEFSPRYVAIKNERDVPLLDKLIGNRRVEIVWGVDGATAIATASVIITPKLRVALMEFEGHFGRKIVMSSGYRNPFYNEKVGGADGSYHTKCMAADFFIPGVDKRKLIAYAVRNGNVGGLGCYPGREFIHIDVRDRPRGWRRA